MSLQTSGDLNDGRSSPAANGTRSVLRKLIKLIKCIIIIFGYFLMLAVESYIFDSIWDAAIATCEGSESSMAIIGPSGGGERRTSWWKNSAGYAARCFGHAESFGCWFHT